MPFKKYKKGSELSYALGITLTFELLKFKPQYAERIYIHSQIKKNENYEKLEALCRATDTEIIFSDKPFNILSEKENVFVIGVFRKFDMQLESTKPHIVLHNPSNAGNIGTIMRSALGFNMGNIAIIRPGVDIYDPKAVRASMGAVFSCNIEYFDTFDDYDKAFGDNRDYYPFMLQAKTELYDVKKKGPVFSLIFGNEATGLPDEFLKIGTPLIINISDRIDSLNLPIAASIAMYNMSNLSTRNGRNKNENS